MQRAATEISVEDVIENVFDVEIKDNRPIERFKPQDIP